MPRTPQLDRHYDPGNFSDRIAYAFVVLLRSFADTFFARRYGHRAVVLKTVAALPGTVGGVLQHSWKLAPDARLHDVIVAVHADEARHRDVNHALADELA